MGKTHDCCCGFLAFWSCNSPPNRHRLVCSRWLARIPITGSRDWTDQEYLLKYNTVKHHLQLSLLQPHIDMFLDIVIGNVISTSTDYQVLAEGNLNSIINPTNSTILIDNDIALSQFILLLVLFISFAYFPVRYLFRFPITAYSNPLLPKTTFST